MPRKKAAAAAVPGGETAPAAPAAFQGACPACKSKITVNHHGNAVLHEKSAYLEELLETDAGIDEAEKLIEKKLADRDATIADLRGRLASAETQLAAANKKPEVKKESEHGPVQQTAGDGKTRKPSWWD